MTRAVLSAATVEPLPAAPHLHGPTPIDRGAREDSNAAPVGDDALRVAPIAQKRRSKRAGVAALATTAVILASAGIAYLLARGKETTDDSQIEGHLHNVASRVQGTIVAVPVRDNQQVHVGDVLVQLDPADLQARFDLAKAETRSAEAAVAAAKVQLALTRRTVDASLQQAHGAFVEATWGVTAARMQHQQSEAGAASARARQVLAQAEFDRVNQLAKVGALPDAQLDAARAAVDQANASMTEATAKVAGVRASIDAELGSVETAQGRIGIAQTGTDQVELAAAQVQLAEARVEQARVAAGIAELNLSYTTIRAPSDGVIAHRSAEVGQSVSPERNLLAIVSLSDVWVVANFKEDQLADIRPGQPSDVRVDTYGRRIFHAYVESIAPGTGSRFALLPADNASGNFTKVVQRVPVLLRIELQDDAKLRPGMSANVTVYRR